MDEKTKQQLLVTADLYLAPALYGESFGIVLLEAMASGTAMVGYGNDGYLNVIKGNGRIFPTPCNLTEFTSKIEKLYLNPKIRSEMIAWGLKEAKKYDWADLATKIESLYKSV